MTLTKRSLKTLGEGMRIGFTEEQELLILERFSEEPLPYEWSEQDVFMQIRKIVAANPSSRTHLPDFLKDKW